MKFSIADILWTTIAAAILFAILRFGPDGWIVAFGVLTLSQIALPCSILLAIIVFADRKGPMLDFSTLPGWRVLKKHWLLSFACTVLVRLVIFRYLNF